MNKKYVTISGVHPVPLCDVKDIDKYFEELHEAIVKEAADATGIFNINQFKEEV